MTAKKKNPFLIRSKWEDLVIILRQGLTQDPAEMLDRTQQDKATTAEGLSNAAGYTATKLAHSAANFAIISKHLAALAAELKDVAPVGKTEEPPPTIAGGRRVSKKKGETEAERKARLLEIKARQDNEIRLLKEAIAEETIKKASAVPDIELNLKPPAWDAIMSKDGFDL